MQVHCVMEELQLKKFRQHPEMVPGIVNYLFEHLVPKVEVSTLNMQLTGQQKVIVDLQKMVKDINFIISLIITN